MFYAAPYRLESTTVLLPDREALPGRHLHPCPNLLVLRLPSSEHCTRTPHHSCD